MLNSILSCAPRSRLSVIGSRLEAAPTDTMSVDDQLTLLHWLCVCGKEERAATLLAALERLPLAPKQQGRLWAVRLRRALAAGHGDIALPQGLPLPKWVDFYRRTGVEMIFPTIIDDIALDVTDNDRLTLELWLTCPACRKTVRTTLRSNLLPYKTTTEEEPEAQWICPDCLCTRQWNRAEIRQQIFKMYDGLYQALPRTDEGLLSDEDATLAVMCAIAVRPLGLVRFGALYVTRIGHFVINTVVYGMECLAGLHEPSLDYFGLNSQQQVTNVFLAEIWDRVLTLSPAADQVRALAVDTEHAFIVRKSYDNNDLVTRFPPSWPFTAKEHRRAREELERMGIPAGSRLACLHARDSAYLTNIQQSQDNADYSNSYRNVRLEDCLPAMEHLAQAGYYVLRMGSIMERPLPVSKSRIIDYATKHRTPFMDVWLFTHCDLCVSSGSGPDAFSIYSNRHTLIMNFIPMGYTFFAVPSVSSLYKHLQHQATGSRLSLEEILSGNVATMVSTAQYEEAGLRVMDNTAEEVLAAVEEKLFLMHGGTRNEEDVYLQEAFFRLVDKHRPNLVDRYNLPPLRGQPLFGPVMRGMTSAVFLRSYRDELLALR